MSQTTATTIDVKHLSSDPVFGLKGAIYLDPSGTFACIERAKAGTFAREFTETIQNDPHLKRFLSSLWVCCSRLGASAQVLGQNLLTFRVIYHVENYAATFLVIYLNVRPNQTHVLHFSPN